MQSHVTLAMRMKLTVLTYELPLVITPSSASTSFLPFMSRPFLPSVISPLLHSRAFLTFNPFPPLLLCPATYSFFLISPYIFFHPLPLFPPFPLTPSSLPNRPTLIISLYLAYSPSIFITLLSFSPSVTIAPSPPPPSYDSPGGEKIPYSITWGRAGKRT